MKKHDEKYCSMKTIDFNINNYVLVKLTDKGIKELKKIHDELQLYAPSIGDFKLKLTKDGYYKTQMWCLMQDLGNLCCCGMDGPIGTNIKIETK